MSQRLFGTDGVRGVANVSPMTVEMAMEIGRATAYACKRHEKNLRHRIVIGKDTRLSGYMLENALTAGICSMGVNVFLVGPMPTPGIAFITRSMRADAGLVISASHNPYQDNGIKIFSRDGFKLPDDEENEIEELIVSGRIRDIRPTALEVGKAQRIDDAIGRYIVFCKDTFPESLTLERMKVVLDCANGATYRIAPTIFSELGADIVPIHVEPNGVNINDGCGSQHPADLIAAVRHHKADVGLAFDGDGDRLIAVDETGEILTGDHLLVIAAKLYKDQGRLANDIVTTTVMANLGLHKALEAMGIHREISGVGDRYVLEQMRANGSIVGGEASGHLLFLDHHTTGDGIIAALQLLSAMRTYDQPLSSLRQWMTVAPQQLINVTVKRKPPMDEVSDVADVIRVAERELEGEGRVLVRYSGTQDVCRVMVEALTMEQADRLAAAIATVVETHLG